MFGRTKLEPVLAEARERLDDAKNHMTAIVGLLVMVLIVGLCTLCAVLR